MNREPRTVPTFVAEYARANDLDAEAAQLLTVKTNDVQSWVKAFRRALGYAERYPVGHPSRVRAIEAILETTQRYVASYGTLQLEFHAEGPRTLEGYLLPRATEADQDDNLFYPLFRDGVSNVTFRAGVGHFELDTLMEIIANRGRRDGDDAMTWLWSVRFRCIFFEAETSLTPDVVGALFGSERNDLAVGAFIDALEAAGPFSYGSDSRTTFTGEHLAILGDQGLDVESAEGMLTGDDNPYEKIVPISDATREAVRTAYGDPAERARRADALRNLHYGSGR